MVRSKPALPHGHGELLARPPVSEWAGLAQDNRGALAAPGGPVVGGVPLDELRIQGRAESLAEAVAFSRRLGVAVDEPAAEPGPFFVTGHQPDLFHTGVWVKTFLLQRLAEETGGIGIDLVVDTDTYDSVRLTAPCMSPRVDRCTRELTRADGEACFLNGSVPSEEDLAAFCASGREMLSTLRAPAIGAHFEAFCQALYSSADEADNLSELMTFSRRRFEASADTTYLELPVSRMCSTPAYRRFVSHILQDPVRFADAYNAELSQYRSIAGTRSSAQPFPDLRVVDGQHEVPFWIIDGAKRRAAWLETGPGGSSITDGGDVSLALGGDVESSVGALGTAEILLAPRAVTLTMYARLVLADLFVHGVGGARYDSITDGVIRRFFGIEPPEFAVASLTMYLPLGAHVVSDEEIAEARHRLHRLEHNPDESLDEVEFESDEERSRAVGLADEKSRLVEAIGAPGADKKQLGARIREVNAELGKLLAPVAGQLRSELVELEGQREAADVLTDRTYPYCFWSPAEIQDKIR